MADGRSDAVLPLWSERGCNAHLTVIPEEGTTSPQSFEVEVSNTEPEASPTPTETNHPGYPYREHTHTDTDLDEAMTR